MDKTNVLMIGPDRSVHGGISGVVNGYYEAGLDKKINLEYIGTMKEGSKLKKLFIALSAYVRFLSALKCADVVHVHVASDNSFNRKSIFIKAAYKKGKKIIIHQHGGDFENWYNGLSDERKASVKSILDMSDTMLVIAPYLKVFFAKLINEDKIEVFPDAIDVKKYSEWRSYEGASVVRKSHSILFLGRLCKEKGIKELLECMPILIKKYPDIKLYLGGIWENGSEDLKALAESMPSNVEYLGWVSGEDKLKILHESEIFVLPSYFEGQSVAILEAMASGCTVVASDVGGIPMMVKDGETGLLVNPKDSGSLLDSLKKVFEDDNLKVKLASAGQRLVEERFDIKKGIELLCGLYENI